MSLDIGKVIYEQEAFNFYNWIHGYRMNPQALPQAVDNFLNILKESEVKTVLVGAIAMLAYVENRNTYDLDLIIKPQDFQKIAWYVDIVNDEREGDDFINCLTQDGLRVDFLLTSNHIFDLVMKNFSQKINFKQGAMQTATPEGLVLMKLYAIADLNLRAEIFNDSRARKKARQYRVDVLNLLDDYEINLPLIFRLLKNKLNAAQIEELQTWLEKNSAE